jgi:hypothetical protein
MHFRINYEICNVAGIECGVVYYMCGMLIWHRFDLNSLFTRTTYFTGESESVTVASLSHKWVDTEHLSALLLEKNVSSASSYLTVCECAQLFVPCAFLCTSVRPLCFCMLNCTSLCRTELLCS